MAGLQMESLHFVKGIDPIADLWEGGATTEVVSMRDYEKCLFVIHEGVGTTGTFTMTILAADNVTPDNTTAVPFWYRTITSGDTPGTLTKATTAGFTSTAGSSHLYIAEVESSELASEGFEYVQASFAEGVDAAVLAGVLIILANPRYSREPSATAIV